MTKLILTEEKKAALAKKAKRQELIEDCCAVRGPHPFLGTFEEDIFKYDNWNVEDGLNYLAGVKTIRFIKNIPESLEIVTLSQENYRAAIDKDITTRFENEITRLWEIWTSGHHENPNPPNYYIEWALSKNIKIHWLDYAIEKGFIFNINKELIIKTKVNKKELFDKDSSTYPPELDYAMQAWEAVKDDKGKGKPKAKVKAWLDANTKLSNEAKDRISIVVNWDKSGGATRTD